MEDGPEVVSLKPGIREVIRTLDERGIVNSIASRNDERHAMRQLERFGLRNYFAFQRIGWYAKGAAVRRIIRDFNIGENAVAFIDDSEFEREEVRASNPGVHLYSAEQYARLPDKPEFSPAASSDSHRRRGRYQDQERRNSALRSHDGEYMDFLRKCGIRLCVGMPSLC